MSQTSAAKNMQALIAGADPSNLVLFKAIVSLAFSENIVTKNEFAIEFELGGLVDIWTMRNLHANPHPRSRSLVYAYLVSKCEP